MLEAIEQRPALRLLAVADLEHADLPRRHLDAAILHPLLAELRANLRRRIEVVLLLVDLAGVEVGLRVVDRALYEARTKLLAARIAALRDRRARVLHDTGRIFGAGIRRWRLLPAARDER